MAENGDSACLRVRLHPTYQSIPTTILIEEAIRRWGGEYVCDQLGVASTEELRRLAAEIDAGMVTE